jgi:hypothetical protein
MIFCFLALLSLFFFRKGKISSLMTVTAILICFLCIAMPPAIAQKVHHRSFMALRGSRAQTSGRELSFYSSYQMDTKEKRNYSPPPSYLHLARSCRMSIIIA